MKVSVGVGVGAELGVEDDDSWEDEDEDEDFRPVSASQMDMLLVIVPKLLFLRKKCTIIVGKLSPREFSHMRSRNSRVG